jgi:hypothetical protein
MPGDGTNDSSSTPAPSTASTTTAVDTTTTSVTGLTTAIASLTALITSMGGTSGGIFASMALAAEKLATSVGKLTGNTETAAAVGHTLTQGLKSTAEVTAEVEVAASKFADTLFTVKGATGAVSGGVYDYSKALETGAKAGDLASNGVALLTSKLGVLGGVGSGAIKSLLSSAGEAKQFENFFLTTAAASGKLGAVFDASGKDFSNFSEVAESTAMMLADVNEATSGNIQETLAAYKEIESAIPGFANSVVSSTAGATKGMTDFSKAIFLAAGTGRSFKDTSDLINSSIQNGFKKDAAMAYVAEISRVSSATSKYGLNLADTQKFMTEAQSSFAMMSHDGTNASMVLESLGEGFTKVGYSAHQAATLSGGLLTNVKNLSTAQLARISMSTGGPGGLQGALQQENRIAKGDVAGVAKDMIDSFQKTMGGKALTLEEAGKSASNAAQYERQRAMVESGALGLKGNRADGSSKAIMDILASGDINKLSEMLKQPKDSGQATLDKAVERGQQVKDALGGGQLQADINAQVKGGFRGEFNSARKVDDATGAGNSNTRGGNEQYRNIINGLSARRERLTNEVSQAANAHNQGGIRTNNNDQIIDVLGNTRSHIESMVSGAVQSMGFGASPPKTDTPVEKATEATKQAANKQAASIAANKRDIHAAVGASTAKSSADKAQLQAQELGQGKRDGTMHVQVDVKGVCVVCNNKVDQHSLVHNPTKGRNH